MIAALFVQPKGCYSKLENVDPWPEARDARLYAGPYPTVCHPPCARWCALAGLVEHRYPQYKRGEDGGCFESALASVRRWGGVLEHPAYTRAWAHFGLPDPPDRGGWMREMFGPGWVCSVFQSAYGHRARKATWLYYVGDQEPAPMRWERPRGAAWISWRANHGEGPAVTGDWLDKTRRDGGISYTGKISGRAAQQKCERMGKLERNATPKQFRDALIALAESARLAPQPANQ